MDEPSRGMAEMNGRVISDATADFGGEDGMADMFAGGDLAQNPLLDETLQQHVSLPDAPDDISDRGANISDRGV